MKKTSTIYLLIACAMLFGIKSFATIHRVTVSSQFTPSTVSAVTGDTMRWVWLSGFHTSTNTGTAPNVLPAGASSWNFSFTGPSDSSDYVLTVAGNYSYWCNIHHFTGSLSVSQSTGIITNSPPVNHLDVISSASYAEIKFYIPADGRVNLSIYDLTGKKVQTILDNELIRGEYNHVWDAISVPQGTYLCRLESREFISTRKFIIRK